MRRLNLTFHGLGEPPRRVPQAEADFWVGPDDFESALDCVCGREDVHVTFDDGNASDVEIALPELRARGLTATFFVIAGRLGLSGYLDPNGVRDLLHAGMCIGSHGFTHKDWRTLGDDELRGDLAEARRELEMVARGTISEVSCPFGSYDRRVLRRLRQADYGRVYTSDGGWAKANSWLQPRNTLRNGLAAGTVEFLLRAPTAREQLESVLRRTIKRWR